MIDGKPRQPGYPVDSRSLNRSRMLEAHSKQRQKAPWASHRTERWHNEPSATTNSGRNGRSKRLDVKPRKADEGDSRKTSRRFAALVNWLGESFPREDRTIVGDAADLYVSCLRVRRLLDEVLSTSHSKQSRELMRQRVSRFMTSVEYLGDVVRDLRRPLRRLIRSLPSSAGRTADRRLTGKRN